MAMLSMPISLPTPTRSNFRRVNRYSGMAFASLSKEITTSLGVRLTEGEGNLPKVVLTSPQGSEADIYLFGGCVTSWKIPNGKDLLFVRPDAVFNKKKPISGGLPHCFPQFGPGQIQQHGFARNVDWSIVDSENVDGNPVVTLELKDGPYSHSMWDFSFQALYKALVTGASVRGLKGCKTLNKDPDPKNPVEGKEERNVVTFPGFVDCIYLDAPDELHLDNGLGDIISIKNTNWTDAVLWNPHLQMEACYKDFVCVENAKTGTTQLEPGQSWTATQLLSIN
ncbi:Aldose 1-/Glucose-6-phosphate 1-epimerase [Parasponia andersonii]|uniref:glucose-6-phosphate 1-epimerase n=1 Tax=Parasponia andersonii TaxID=3476 RepID=A0A2P5DDN6_PARAD|nr:Aldose 1-/Glucose-6-phosphate 1-epimerase [Parasponia andersonii]